ncbi:hypothetical protein LINPERPRIM_LOCUS31343 [Linum perenne]
MGEGSTPWPQSSCPCQESTGCRKCSDAAESLGWPCLGEKIDDGGE